LICAELLIDLVYLLFLFIKLTWSFPKWSFERLSIS